MDEWDYHKYRTPPVRYMHHRVVLFDGEKYYQGWPSSNATEFIEWLSGLVARVPEEFRESATIEISSVSGYDGDHHASIEVSYRRPETDEELAARMQDYRRVQTSRLAHEKAEFERLKAKFG